MDDLESGGHKKDLDVEEAHSIISSLHDARQTGNEPVGALDKQEPEDPSHIVTWNGPDDPDMPQNFPRWKKWLITMSCSALTLTTTFSSSIFSTGTLQAAKEFHVSPEVMILGTSTFLIGLAIGPVFFAPLSELYGRRPPLLAGFIIFTVFQIPVAVAQNVETIMLGRFLQGFGGATMPSVVGGVLADCWNPRERGFAMPAFAAALFAGPTCGPIVGAFIVESHLGWRWTQWITLIMACGLGIPTFITYPETYAPVLLTRRARRLRHSTQNWALHSQHEERQVELRDIAEKYLLRPMKMLVMEPILALLTIYQAFVYGLLFLFFESYPVVFVEIRGLSPGIASLPFLSILIGVLIACAMLVCTTKTRLSPDPAVGRMQEARMILMILGGSCVPVGLFWFAWTSSPSISPWPQIIAGAPVGFGIILINLQAFNYIIDCYAMHANSAIAGNTIIRSLFGAGFPLFATAMYHNLGASWATSVLAFIGVALIPVPIVFFRYGAKIRTWSRYVQT